MLKNISKSEYSLIYIFSALFVPYTWSAYLSALLGIFFAPVVYGGALIGTMLFLWYGRAHLIRFSRRQYISILFALFIGVIVILFMHPSTFYTGRDQGAIATAAALLVEHGTPYTSTPAIMAFFEIYGPGQALNYPGFHYSQTGDLITQFPLPYIAFIAGLPYANGILIAGFLILFGSLVRICSRDACYEYIGYTLLLSAFPFLWFARYTLSENLTLLLLWLTCGLFFLLGDRTRPPHLPTYFLFLLSLSILLFVRIEGIWFLCAFITLLFAHHRTRAWLKEDVFVRILLPGTLLLCISVLALLISWPFYKTLGALLISKSSAAVTSATASDTESTLLSFFYPAFHAYGITIMLTSIIIALVLCFCDRKLRIAISPLLLITAPLFLYFLEPHISADHPWMLRRYVFWLVPLYAMSTLFLLHQFSYRGRIWSWVGKTLIVGVLWIHLSITSPYFFFRENVDLGHVAPILGHHFTERDLLLIDGHATGDGWAMLPGPLMTRYDLHAVYFFNPDDYTKIDTGSFERVFLIVSDVSHTHFADLINIGEPYEVFRPSPSDKRPPTITEIYGRHLQVERDHFTTLPKKINTTTPITVYQLQ